MKKTFFLALTVLFGLGLVFPPQPQAEELYYYSCTLGRDPDTNEIRCVYSETCPEHYTPMNGTGCGGWPATDTTCTQNDFDTHPCVPDPDDPTPIPLPLCDDYEVTPDLSCTVFPGTTEQCQSSGGTPRESSDYGWQCCCFGPTPTPYPLCKSFETATTKCDCMASLACDGLGGSSNDLTLDCSGIGTCCCRPEAVAPTPEDPVLACDQYSSTCECDCFSSVTSCYGLDPNAGAFEIGHDQCPVCCCHDCPIPQITPVLSSNCTYKTIGSACPIDFPWGCDPLDPDVCCTSTIWCPLQDPIDPSIQACVHYPVGTCPPDWPIRCGELYPEYAFDNLCCASVTDCPTWSSFGFYCTVDKIEEAGIATAFGCIPINPRGITKWFLGIAMPAGGVISFMALLYASLKLVSSSGDPQKVQNAKQLLTAAVSGLILVILAIFILNLVGIQILSLPGF